MTGGALCRPEQPGQDSSRDVSDPRLRTKRRPGAVPQGSLTSRLRALYVTFIPLWSRRRMGRRCRSVHTARHRAMQLEFWTENGRSYLPGRRSHAADQTPHAREVLGEPVEYVLNELIDTVLAKDKEFVAWRAKHPQSFVSRGRAVKGPKRPEPSSNRTRETTAIAPTGSPAVAG